MGSTGLDMGKRHAGRHGCAGTAERARRITLDNDQVGRGMAEVRL